MVLGQQMTGAQQSQLGSSPQQTIKTFQAGASPPEQAQQQMSKGAQSPGMAGAFGQQKPLNQPAAGVNQQQSSEPPNPYQQGVQSGKAGSPFSAEPAQNPFQGSGSNNPYGSTAQSSPYQTQQAAPAPAAGYGQVQAPAQGAQSVAQQPMQTRTSDVQPQDMPQQMGRMTLAPGSTGPNEGYVQPDWMTQGPTVVPAGTAAQQGIDPNTGQPLPDFRNSDGYNPFAEGESMDPNQPWMQPQQQPGGYPPGYPENGPVLGGSGQPQPGGQVGGQPWNPVAYGGQPSTIVQGDQQWMQPPQAPGSQMPGTTNPMPGYPPGTPPIWNPQPQPNPSPIPPGTPKPPGWPDQLPWPPEGPMPNPTPPYPGPRPPEMPRPPGWPDDLPWPPGSPQPEPTPDPGPGDIDFDIDPNIDTGPVWGPDQAQEQIQRMWQATQGGGDPIASSSARGVSPEARALLGQQFQTNSLGGLQQAQTNFQRAMAEGNSQHWMDSEIARAGAANQWGNMLAQWQLGDWRNQLGASGNQFDMYKVIMDMMGGLGGMF